MIFRLLLLFILCLPVNATFIEDIKVTGITSTGNTTTTPLGSAATFTGTGEQNDYPQVGVMVKADNTGTLFFDFSNDGTNWDSTFPVSGFEVASGVSEFHTAVKLGRYFRVRFVNDTGAQSYMRLTTYYGSDFLPSSAPLNQTASLDQDAIFTRSTIPEDDIRISRRSGALAVKFGYRQNLTASAGEQIIWANGTNAFTPMTTGDTFDITYNGSTDGSTSNGATQLTFFYIDANGESQLALHTLGSTGNDTTAFTGLGINRVAISASNGNTFNNSEITIRDTANNTVQAVIPAQGSVTQQAIFFNDNNSDGVVKFLWCNATKPSGSDTVVAIRGYAYNRAVDTRYEVFRGEISTAVGLTFNIVEPVGFNLSPTDVLYFTADTAANDANIRCRFSLREYERI